MRNLKLAKNKIALDSERKGYAQAIYFNPRLNVPLDYFFGLRRFEVRKISLRFFKHDAIHPYLDLYLTTY